MPTTLPRLRFRCSTVSPLFLYGFDKKQPEFREESFIGLFRYWFRAVHTDHLVSRQTESRLFGNADQRGAVDLLVYTHPKSPTQRAISSVEKVPMLPGKTTGNPPMDAISPDVEFTLDITFRKDAEFCAPVIKALVLLSSYVGGVGRRSRRGMGSFRILGITENTQTVETLVPDFVDPSLFLNYLLQQLNVLVPGAFALDDHRIFRRVSIPPSDFPSIQIIWLGKVPKNEKTIYEATHDTNDLYKSDYGDAMGKVTKGRFASPMYTTLVQINNQTYPLITELNVSSELSNSKLHQEIRKSYREKLVDDGNQ